MNIFVPWWTEFPKKSILEGPRELLSIFNGCGVEGNLYAHQRDPELHAQL